MPVLPPNTLEIKSAIKGDRAVYTIEKHPGLYLYVRGAGVASWIVRYRVGGAMKERVLSNDAARADFRKITTAKDEIRIAIKTRGVDLWAERQGEAEAKAREEAAERDTFAVLFEDWLERHAKPNKKSWKADEAIWKRHVQTRMAHLVPATIRRVELVAILDDIANASTPLQANKCQSLVSAIFAWGVNSGRLETSPAYRVPKRAKQVPRERVLTDEEVRRLWAATAEAGVIGDAVRVLLLTGQRRSEVAGMPPNEIDGAGRAWVIPGARTKNSIIHRVPLGRAARAIIDRRISEGGRFVFGGRADSSTGFVSPDAITRFLWKLRLGEPAATVHDIRRTVGTRMAEMRVPKDVRAAVLNHVNGARSSVTDAVYNQYEGEDEKRRALRLWELRLRGIISNRKANAMQWAAPSRRGLR